MKRSGFTLIELMIVLIIIGILATVGIVQYQSAVEKARGSEAKSVLNHLRQKCAALYYESGIGACTPENLSIGNTANGYEVAGGGCRQSHYFQYFVTTKGDSEATFRAARCTAGGKNPQYRSISAAVPNLTIVCNFSNATSCNAINVTPAGVY
jgi:prepilin-type N-terminal cleavage/methylation domain-containing protein